MSTPLSIDYFSDILCIWAWIAQRRIEEMNEHWGDQVTLNYRFVNLFGDTKTKMQQQWGDRGGFDGFGQHVLEAAAPYDNAPVSALVWQQVRPTTSGTAHLVLKATELAFGSTLSASLATDLRRAFFVDSRDVSQLNVVLEIAERADLDTVRLQALIDNGEAMAALMTDYKMAQDQNVKGSPTWIMNNGRQVLYGNVGYRVLHANIEEILKHPQQEASWC